MLLCVVIVAYSCGNVRKIRQHEQMKLSFHPASVMHRLSTPLSLSSCLFRLMSLSLLRPV